MKRRVSVAVQGADGEAGGRREGGMGGRMRRRVRQGQLPPLMEWQGVLEEEDLESLSQVENMMQGRGPGGRERRREGGREGGRTYRSSLLSR